MNTPKKTTDAGLTGFSMRVGRDQSVRFVNGTMFKLLSAKNANILTRILSLHMFRTMLRAILYAKRKNRRADNTKSSYPRTFGLIGLQTRYAHPGWVSSMTSRELRARKARRGMSQNISSNQPFSRMIGLKDGSASDIVRAFQNRRKNRPTQ